MNIPRLSEDNFLVYCIKNYDCPHDISMEEFESDLKRIKYLKRHFNKFLKTGQLKERLIINHLTVLYNVFDIEAATNILFYKLDDDMLPVLKPFLQYMSLLPQTVCKARPYVIYTSEIPINIEVIRRLRLLDTDDTNVQ